MIWRPFTQEKNTPPPLKVVRGEGLYLYTDTGKKYADMISSWWVNVHGHGHPEIAGAIAQQARTLEQVIFTTFSHAPAEQLTQLLQTCLPETLDQFFFSDDGSTSVEVAIKMAYQFFANQGEPQRNLYLHQEGAYHGDTYGSMSLSGKDSQYHFNFSHFFFKTLSIPVPTIYTGVEDIEAKEAKALQALRQILEKHGSEICALIIEPLIQGARGMVLHRPEFLEQVMACVRAYGILVIFDEVFTGFYRTGRRFAMDYLAQKPDIVCLSKGLTGGFLPLALTVTTSKIYQAFLSEDPRKALIHGHSYTANPIACAAACKSLEILNRPATLKQIANIEQYHRSKGLKNVQKHRSLGIMTAFDLPSPQHAQTLAKKLFNHGIFLRPLGQTIYLLPPYCITTEELDWVYACLESNLNEIK